MMRRILACVVLPVVSGCLSASVPNVVHWPVEYKAGSTPAAAAKYGVARVTHVSVRAPYNVDGLAVLREDGSMAFDPYNVYAAAPGLLLRGVVYDALVNSGLFASVLNASSTAASEVSVELMVTRLALDCRAGDRALRTARAEVVLRLIDPRGGLIKTVPASGEAVVEGGDFGVAFSKAVSEALEQALAGSL